MGRVENEEGDYGRFLLSLVVYCIKTIILIWLNVDNDDYDVKTASNSQVVRINTSIQIPIQHRLKKIFSLSSSFIHFFDTTAIMNSLGTWDYSWLFWYSIGLSIDPECLTKFNELKLRRKYRYIVFYLKDKVYLLDFSLFCLVIVNNIFLILLHSALWLRFSFL